MGFAGIKLPKWQFSLQVTSDQVYDGFTILSLLEDCKTQQATLVVPHGGLARDRFTEAVCARNERLRLSSQPEILHHCNKCTRFYSGMFFPSNFNGLLILKFDIEKKVSVVVIDGVTLGHPCCGEPNCKVPLANNHDRFCPIHTHLNQICAVVHCSLPTVIGRKTCAFSGHEAVENVHNERGQARFQLKERLRRAQLAHPRDAFPVEAANSISQLVDDDNTEEEFDFNSRGQIIPVEEQLESTRKTTRTLRAQFGRKRTHNEQIFVAPCGIIIARETFYHAEAIYSVIVRLQHLKLIKNPYKHGINRR